MTLYRLIAVLSKEGYNNDMFSGLYISHTVVQTAIKAAELRTTGQIRVCVERRNRDDLFLRAQELFHRLGMRETSHRNGVLLYIHLRRREILVLGDEGIDGLVPEDFWQNVCDAVTECFARNRMTVGAVLGVQMVGEQLAAHFPSPVFVAHNELDDSLVNGDAL